MKRLLWLLLGLGGGLLLASGGSERRQLPGTTLEDNEEDIVDADFEIIEDDEESDGHREGTPDIIETVVGATQQHGVTRSYEKLIRESIHYRGEWQQKFTYQELVPIEHADPDVQDFIAVIEQAGPVDEGVLERLQDLHRHIYHRRKHSSSLHLHCPFCRRDTTPSGWYCSYCGVKHKEWQRSVIRRCDCRKKATALVCQHCQISIPLLAHPAEVEWDMPAIPSKLVVSKDDRLVPHEDDLSDLERKHEHQQKKKKIEREARRTELVNDVDDFLQFRHQLEALYSKEEERLAEKHGRDSEEYENGLRELSTLLTNLEGQCQDDLRNNNLADEPPTQTL